jgi:hypothetical protein
MSMGQDFRRRPHLVNVGAQKLPELDNVVER